jgi:hypothetical protein
MKKLTAMTAATWCLFLVSCLGANQPKAAATPSKGAEQTKDAKTADTYYVVEYNGYDGQVSNLVMTTQEYDTLTNSVDAETAVFKEALKLAEQDWQSSGSKNKAFPHEAISRKKYKVAQKTTDLSKATDRKKALDEKLSAKEDAAKKAIKDKQDKLKESDDQKKKDDARAKEVEGMNNLARKIFEKRVTELLGKSGASSGTNAVPASASAPAAEPKK